MSLEIISVHDQGDHEMEHVLLKAHASGSISRFLLADGQGNCKTGERSPVRHVFWFPDTEIAAGDYISLWTKPGTNTTDRMTDGTPVHRFFWNLAEPIWNDAGGCALLLELKSWQCYRVHEN